MNRLRHKNTFLVIALLAAGTVAFTWLTRQQKIDYNSDVKPILNKNCITCHGGVRRKAGFSLLFRSEAMANTESGKPAIIPGDPDHSEMIRRLTLKDPEERMPYRHEALSSHDISILRNWIKQGAPWGEHWAYTAVQPEPVPPLKQLTGFFSSGNGLVVRNEIDNFILDKLRDHDLTPSPEAGRAALLRRVSFDLIGMPAPGWLQHQYINDSSNTAYERLVDSLLASPHYGEKWAAMWLDLARYADTKGYERDDARTIWRYRDWLIKAFNENKPFNQFLTEQLAGDLLPNPTEDQLIATAFHRNTMTNDEGGTDNEEFRTAAVLDRVNTTWEALMGTTFACVQCHSHPYDPFTHEEYYKFMAFFNNTRDEDSYADYPLLRSFSDSAKMEKKLLTDWLTAHATPERTKEIDQFLADWQPSVNSLACDQFINSELSDTKWAAFRNNGLCRLKNTGLNGASEIIYRYRTNENGGVLQFHADSPDGPVLATLPIDPVKEGWGISRGTMVPLQGRHNLFLTYHNAKLKKQDDTGVTFDWFYFTRPFPGEGQPGYAAAAKRYWDLLTMKTPVTPIMVENPENMHRLSHVFERGNWLVEGQVVTPGTPHALNPMPPGAPRNRLGLAQWMTSTQNPLTARTFVNRVWEQLFGTGLVETVEDFGTQGIPPTHRELLNYLSWQFMHTDNWDIKKLLKKIVLSATYRQDSRASDELLKKDDANKFYARGPRVRLSAEALRDQALCITGMLSEKMYGPSVMPEQPEGIWRSPYDGARWVTSRGPDKYRRALYTYWKRTAPYPAMMTFDGVAREVCTPRRIRTNTPLQALAGLNDEASLDMARQMAERLVAAMPGDANDQIKLVYERATGHVVPAAAMHTLLKLYDRAQRQFSASDAAACQLSGSVRDRKTMAEIASLVVVINTVLNLDEVVTKE